ncbi:PulJ/GspJ family protein [Halodesulfovibrio marinisediminis]|uniref:Type II secretion system protein J n=1 Tax=Halodesulfovibrio marinisediminis DSM 17456 TaxID=1121457 RepID=A0A1N6GZS5_9BACT|nr:prepilin-type N-terminal cleavage/methylation domain-containing protein [Halodesulfovibrio marinisediminis]SIO13009.1 type II secretion system protein J [Halodesulfovibrio marinisediminis DSM 17456]
MQQKKNHPQAGFTLLEVLIAIMLMATIMTTLFGVFTHVLNAAQHARKHMESDRVGRAILGIIAEDIRYMHPDTTSEHLKFSTMIPPNDNSLPEERTILGLATTSSLKFSEHPTSYSLQYVTYSIIKNGTGDFSLFRNEQPFPTIEGKLPLLRYKLVNSMRSCTFSYYDKARDEFRQDWDNDRMELPEAIRIEFFLGEAEPPYKYSLVIPLPKRTS